MGWAFEYVSPVIHPCPETMCISSFDPSFFDSQDPASVIQPDMTVQGRRIVWIVISTNQLKPRMSITSFDNLECTPRCRPPSCRCPQPD